MTLLAKQIRVTQHRLWLNRWLHGISWFWTAAAAMFGIVVLLQRLFDTAIPLLWIGLALACGAWIASCVQTIMKREGSDVAAARLDQAAGLRERLSSACYCITEDDPFARAVVTDAERISRSLSARSHIRLVLPGSFSLAVLATVVTSLMFLLPTGLLVGKEKEAEQEQRVQVQKAKVAVKRQMDKVQQMVQTIPALKDLKDKLDDTELETGGKLQRPSDIRHEAIKKIDKLADAVKQKRKSGKYDAVKEMRKMMRGIKTPRSADGPTNKLAKALARGDFKTAREEVNALREQLATLKSSQDQQLVKKMSKRLQDLAKQLNKLSKHPQLAKKLAQAGLKKEDVQRILQHLKKNDLDQVKKQLAHAGLSKQQIQKIAKQLQAKQQASSAAKKLAQAMSQGAQAQMPGQMGNAMSGLSMAADQLSQLEMLDQEMSQLDSTLADLQNESNKLGHSQPGGNRCGMGKLGNGRGGLASEKKTDIGFKIERGKVPTGKGAIIGQFLFDGPQVKGDLKTRFSQVVAAAEQDASDRINRNRIPRQFQKSIKAYFSTMKKSIRKNPARPAKPSHVDPTTEEVETQKNDRP